MPITADIIRKAVATAAAALPQMVVQLARTYVQAGTQRTALYSGAILVGMKAMQRIGITGSTELETFELTSSDIPDGESEAVQAAKAGERIVIKKDDNDAGSTYTILAARTENGIQFLTIGPKHG